MPVGPAPRLRVVTYNIKGLSRDAAALTAAVRGLAPDVLVLQEVLRWPDPRTWFSDLAGRFGMARAFGGLSAFGNAVLVSTAVVVHGRRVVRYPFSVTDSPRAAMLVRCSVNGVEFVAAGSHLSTVPALRRRQAATMTDALDCAGAPVVAGEDVNEASTGPAWRTLAAGLVDAAEETGQADVATFPTPQAVRRIDAVFVGASLPVLDYRVVDTPQTRLASDHFPLLVDLALTPQGP
jgi:endonuclease/exonuclease/phosphatase family metal-dependent hydrolase